MNFDAYTVSLNGVVRYVGVTMQGVMVRWQAHKSPSSACIAVKNAIKKHGHSSFTVEHVACAGSLKELGDLEDLLIKQYHTMSPRGYNLKSGGIKNIVFSDEVLDKMRLANTGRKLSDETRKKISLARTGRKFRKLSNETRMKMSIAHAGKKHKPHKAHKPYKRRRPFNRQIDTVHQLNLL